MIRSTGVSNQRYKPQKKRANDEERSIARFVRGIGFWFKKTAAEDVEMTRGGTGEKEGYRRSFQGGVKKEIALDKGHGSQGIRTWTERAIGGVGLRKQKRGHSEWHTRTDGKRTGRQREKW